MSTAASSVILPPCTVLRLAGPDRERYLNGQVTNDVRLATPGRAIFSAVLNGKGQLDAVCWIREHDGDYLLDAPAALREALLARLDRYIIADDVVLSDESDRWSLVHLLGTDPGGPAPEAAAAYACERFGTVGCDLLFPRDAAPENLPPALTPEDILALRIERGIPAWSAELVPGLLPPEAGLDATAISYDKGCYLGQEVISRMKRAGKTNRHLVKLDVPAGLAVPADLLHDGASAGTVTSVSPKATDGRAPALGFRKRKFAGIDLFEAGGQPVRVVTG